MLGEPRLLTASFWSIDPDWGVPVRTSVGHPRGRLGYELTEAIRDLMPFGKANGTPLRQVKDLALFKQGYVAQLNRVGVERLRFQFRDISERHDDRPLVLLCFENPRDLETGKTYCHRRIFADWWEGKTGERVIEGHAQEELA